LPEEYVMIELFDDEDPTYSLGSLSITLEREYPQELWEKIEDAVAVTLARLNLRGSIENSVTGNSTTIQRKKINERNTS